MFKFIKRINRGCFFPIKKDKYRIEFSPDDRNHNFISINIFINDDNFIIDKLHVNNIVNRKHVFVGSSDENVRRKNRIMVQRKHVKYSNRLIRNKEFLKKVREYTLSDEFIVKSIIEE
jgi:hypothetical protein